MAVRSAFIPGVSRTVAWVPTEDTARTRGPDPGSVFSAGRQWTPFGLVALGHTLSINVATGGLTVSVNDLSIPYQGLPLQVRRTLDVQEQHAQQDFIERHPNTDPRFHFFANWQLQTETQVSASWNHTFPELLINDGDGESALFYRDYADFDVNESDGASVEAKLRSYGIAGRTLAALGWQFAPFDSLLRTRRGTFAVLTGRFQAETMVDPVDLRLWRFEPITGMGYRYTSEFAYQEFIDVDGLREVTVPSVLTQAVDGLGHSLTFVPTEAAPPHRAYLISDGSARSVRLELNDFVTYLDGNNVGGRVKSYMVSRAIDQTRAAQNVIEYNYDQSQRLVEVSYPGQAGGASRVVTYGYDSEGHLVGITDPIGNSFHFTYADDPLDSDERLEPRFKLTRIADDEGNSIAYQYDHPNKLVTVISTGADGNMRSVVFTYIEDADDTGQRFITSQTSQVTLGYSGNQMVRSSQTYSADGRYLVDKSIDPLGNTYAFEYNDFNQRTAITDPIGHRRDLTFDVQLIPNPLHPNRYDLIQSSEQNLDVDGNLFPVQSSAVFESYEPVTSSDPADANQSTHRIMSRTDELGNVWTYSYDDAANANPLRPTATTDPMGKTTARTYDPIGCLLSEIDATGNSWQWQYNSQGQRVVCIDPNGFKFYWVYDPGTGWLADVTDALGTSSGDPAHSVHYVWNDAGQRLSENDPTNAIADYGYFRNGRLKSITRYDPAARSITFEYDASGTLRVLTDPLGHQTVFQIDEAGRVYETFRDVPTNPSIRFTMNAAGRVMQLTDRNGQSRQYGYDALGRITSIQEPNWPAASAVNPGKAVAIKYDFLGQRLMVTDNQLPSAYRYRYDAIGNRKGFTDTFGFQLDYDYNARNDLIHLYDGVGRIDLQFGRDDAGRLSWVTDSNQFDPSRTFRYSRTSGALVDNLYRIDFDTSGISTTFQYDANRRLTQVSHAAPHKVLPTFGYTYRADGLIGTATGSHQANYDYDGLKQLINETDARVQDGYDGVGNRLWRAAAPLPAAQQNVYDGDYRLMNSPVDGTTFSYDANGNMLSRTRGGSVISYSYDGANRLMRVKDGAKTIDYLYDIDGRLLQRTVTVPGNVSTERFQYANGSLLAIVDPNGRVKSLFTRDDDGRLLRRRTPQNLHPAPSTDVHSVFYLHDGLRSIAGLVDWDGKQFLAVDYDAWGQAAAAGALSTTELFRYRGGLYDLDTGLLIFGARWYDPRLGRWQSQDSLILQLNVSSLDAAPHYAELMNLYAYVRNNPLAFSDSAGLQSAADESSKGVITLGLEQSLILPVLAGYFAGGGLYYDRETGFGLYGVVGYGLAFGAEGGGNVEIGVYPSLADLKGKGVELGAAGGAALNVGVNTSWDTDPQMHLVGGAIDIGAGGGLGGYAFKSHTGTLPLGDPVASFVSWWRGLTISPLLSPFGGPFSGGP